MNVADHYRLAAAAQAITTHELKLRARDRGVRRLLHTSAQYGEVRTHDRARRSARTRARLDQPRGLAVDAEDRSSSPSRGRVVRVDHNDAATVVATGFPHPVDLATHAGHWYLGDDHAGTVYCVELDQPAAVATTSPQATIEQAETEQAAAVLALTDLAAHQGLACHNGLLYVVGTRSRLVRSLDLETGQRGSSPTTCHCATPTRTPASRGSSPTASQECHSLRPVWP